MFGARVCLLKHSAARGNGRRSSFQLIVFSSDPHRSVWVDSAPAPRSAGALGGLGASGLCMSLPAFWVGSTWELLSRDLGWISPGCPHGKVVFGRREVDEQIWLQDKWPLVGRGL